MKKIYIIGAFACLFAACKPSVNITKAPTAGDADFTTYMAVGNSLTAGYADGSLYVTSQYNSYPKRLYEQFALIPGGGGATGGFYQPYLATDNGFPNARKVIGYIGHCVGDTTIGPVDLPTYASDVNDAKRYISSGPNGQINNIAVPGIRVADYQVPGYGNPANGAGFYNPYAARFYNDVTKSPLDELDYRERNLHPSFFTMWLGANDVLSYALGGGQGDGSGNAIPFGGAYPSDAITPLTVFQTNFDSAVFIMTRHGAKGVLIGVPDILSIPYFTTIKYNDLYISRRSLADSLNAYYSSLNFTFDLGKNNFVIEDNAGNPRKAADGELILLNVPLDSITCAGWGSFKAIPKQYVLTSDEMRQITTFTTRYNEFIAGAAKRNNLAYLNISDYLSTVSSGIVFNGIKYNTNYISGGVFSLDGVHLTPRGYALVANRIIQEINTKYKSTINQIDVNKYNGIIFP